MGDNRGEDTRGLESPAEGEGLREEEVGPAAEGAVLTAREAGGDTGGPGTGGGRGEVMGTAYSANSLHQYINYIV